MCQILFYINNLNSWPILDIWKNKDESANKDQMHDEEMIRETKRNEVEEELRRQVDYLMREELDLLKIVSQSTNLFLRCYKQDSQSFLKQIRKIRNLHCYYWMQNQNWHHFFEHFFSEHIPF